MMRIVQNVFLPNAATIAAGAIGAFASYGVEVQTAFTRSSVDQRAALLAGEADVAVTALDNLFAWNDADESGFRAVAQIERSTSLPIHLGRGLGSLPDLVALERPRLVVDSVAGGFGIALVAFVQSLGVERERIVVVAAGGVRERLAALAAGDGDVALLAPFAAADAAAARLVPAGRLEERYPDYPGLAIAALVHRARRIEPALRAYLGALRAGRVWLHSGRPAVIEALVAHGLSEPAARAQIAACGSGPLTVSREGLGVLRHLRHEQRMLPATPCGFDDLVTHEFLNNNEED